jgi:hypothetical protein
MKRNAGWSFSQSDTYERNSLPGLESRPFNCEALKGLSRVLIKVEAL